MFGQERVDGEGWRTLLIIELTESAAERFLVSAMQGGKPSFEEVVTNLNLQPEPLSATVSEPSLPNQVASLVANLGLVAVADREACIDFYHASAFALSAVQQSHKLSVDPVSKSLIFVRRCCWVFFPGCES